MEWKRYAVYGIGFAGFCAGLFGFIAEATKRTEGQIKMQVNGRCVYSKSPTLGLGLAAAFFTVFTQVLTNISGGCICCKKGYVEYTKRYQRALAVTFLVLSWITCIHSFILLIAGASLDDEYIQPDDFPTSCYVLKPGVFAAGAILSFMTTILGMVYNIQVRDLKRQDSSAINLHQSPIVKTTQLENPTRETTLSPTQLPEFIWDKHNKYYYTNPKPSTSYD